MPFVSGGCGYTSKITSQTPPSFASLKIQSWRTRYSLTYVSKCQYDCCLCLEDDGLMATMSNRIFLKWIDPCIQYDPGRFSLPSFRDFSVMMWIKVYLTNPMWLFTESYGVGTTILNDSLRFAILNKVLTNNPKKFLSVYSQAKSMTNWRTNEDFKHFVDRHFPHVQLLMI